MTDHQPHDHPHSHAPTDWKHDGVRVVPGDQLDGNVPSTPGMDRKAAINFARVGAQKLWAGTVTIHANAKTGAHHHGHLESVIYDPVGGDYTEPAFRSIAWRGRYLVVGFAAGPIPSLPLNLALLKGASVVGVFWGDYAKREAAANRAMMAELAQWYALGKIKPVIDRTLPMAQLHEAYALMGSRRVMGKLVMVNP